MSKCRQCPIRGNCWDKDNCDDCAIGQKIEKMQRKIAILSLIVAVIALFK